jgi:ribonuclease R
MKEKVRNTELEQGYRVADSSGIPVPSRLQVLEYLDQKNRPVSLKAICAHFKIDDDAIEALSGRLERLRKYGNVLMDRKQRYGLPEKMDMIVGRVVGHPKGFGFVIPDQGGDDLYLHHNQMRKVLHGDRVLARTRSIDNRGRKEGVVVEVLVEQSREIIGHFHLESGIGFVEPDDKRYGRDISIPAAGFNEARDGDIVVARILKHPVEHRHTVGEITEVVGRSLAPGMETEIALRKHEIPHAWPEKVSEQLHSMEATLHQVQPDPSRKDIRNLPLVTIDGIDAKDFDDAVYCEAVKTGWRLVVAIADVSHYVRAGSAMDDEAFKRGNSVYFPNRVVPMLPEQLSNGICSLMPMEDRYCMVCDMQISKSGEITQYEFYPGLMHSRARLTYDLVSTIVVDKDENQRKAWQEVAPFLDQLYQLSLCLRKKRESRGAVEFDFPEPFVEFDESKRIRRISARLRNDAHRLIEECMLAANVSAAEFLQKHRGNNAVYRNHEGPDADSLVELRKFLSGLGLKLGGGDQPEAMHYSDLVESVATRSDIAGVVQSVLLRSLSQAVYSTEQLGHFALAYPIYSHFTSPIRRYSDLVVHRQIKHILDAVKKGKIGPEGVSIGQVGENCSFTERRADDATRDVISWLKAEFMQEKVGEEFDGVISGVKEFGIFVQLKDIFVDGLVHVTSLGNDYYHFDPVRFQLQGEHEKQRFRLGDSVRVRVVRVDLEEAKIDFELVPDSMSTRKIKKGHKSVNPSDRADSPKRKAKANAKAKAKPKPKPGAKKDGNAGKRKNKAYGKNRDSSRNRRKN